jgi:hypothetical protein
VRVTQQEVKENSGGNDEDKVVVQVSTFKNKISRDIRD